MPQLRGPYLLRSRPSRMLIAASALFALQLAGPARAAQHASARQFEALRDGERYFLEFRARRGAFVGHTFIAYGRLDADGKPLEIDYAGNYPVDGMAGLIVGFAFPVRTRFGPVRDDFKDPITNIYRVMLTARQYARLTTALRQIGANEHYWHLVFFNCNDFAVEVAQSLGLITPSPWLVPHAFVSALRSFNSGR